MTAPVTTTSMPAPPARPLLYKVTDVTVMLKMGKTAIYEQIRAGRLKTVKEGRATFITSAALAEYIALLEQEARDAR